MKKIYMTTVWDEKGSSETIYYGKNLKEAEKEFKSEIMYSELEYEQTKIPQHIEIEIYNEENNEFIDTIKEIEINENYYMKKNAWKEFEEYMYNYKKALKNYKTNEEALEYADKMLNENLENYKNNEEIYKEIEKIWKEQEKEQNRR